MGTRGFRVFLFVLTLLANTKISYADVTGSILGVVKDRSEAAVAGAKVVATNVDTHLARETVSTSDGSFRILALPAGTYTLTVTAAGFRPFTETTIVVKVNDQLRFDVTLDVGKVTEEVQVMANALEVQTENTQLGDVIDSKKMLALPLNGRSYIDLLGLQAGVAPATAGTVEGLVDSARPVSGTLNPGNISVNGQRETANAFLVNGGDVSEGRNLGAGLVPNLDSVEEFRLITNSFDAEYGKFSGAIMNAITKSGTNQFHGDAFWFLRNDAFDANNYFANAAGLPKTALHRNQFGAVGGGPILKDRLFWFVDYQGTRQTQGAVTTTSVPTADQRQGNFDPTLLTGTVDGPQTGSGGASSWAQVLSQRLGYPVNSGEAYSFPGCNSTDPVAGCVFPVNPATGLAHIPGNAWSAPAVGILPYIPAPNGPGTVNNFTDNSQQNSWDGDKGGLKIDFLNKRTGNWSFYYMLDDNRVGSALPFASVPGFPSNTLSRAQQFVMSNTRTFGATAVNEARFSFFRTALHKDNPAGSFASLASLGFNNSNGLGIIPSTTPGYPEFVPPIIFNNFQIGVPTLNTFQPNNTYMVNDVFSKSAGKHTWKFGGEFRYLQVNERNYASPNSNFVFDGSATGLDFADYLIGAPATSGGYTQAALQLLDSRTKYGGAFVQDSWKVKPNLTLNLGLRWEVSMPWYDTQGKIQTYNFGQQSTVFPLSPNGLVFPGDKGIPKTLAPTKYDDFGPRVGLAYSPGFSSGLLGAVFGGPGKTSIRAAFGMYYTSVEDLNLFYEVADAPFGLYWSTGVPVMFDEPFRLRQTGQSIGQRFPFTAPIPGSPDNKTLSFQVYEPISYFPGYNIHNVLPYGEHFNLSVQREIARNTLMTIAYVGTEGHHLITQNEANPGNPTLCQQLNAEGAFDVSAQTVGCGFFGENDIYQRPTATVPCDTPSATPLAGCLYGTRSGINTPNFCPQPGNAPGLCFINNNTNTLTSTNSIYNSAQVSVQRQASNFSFLLAYTFGKALDDSSGFNDLVNFVNPKLSRGLSSTDIAQNFVASYIWALPFDRLFANGPKRLTQGWQIQGITRFSTGFPVQLNQSKGDFTLWGSSNTDMPDRVGPLKILNPRNANPDCPTSNNTGCDFIPPTQNLLTPSTPGQVTAVCLPSVGAFAQNCIPGTFGTANRRFFHGPGFNNTDFGLLKHTVIRESLAFDVRMEFFNIFNHTQFMNPGGNISNSSFGVVSDTRPPRIGQFSLKFYW